MPRSSEGEAARALEKAAEALYARQDFYDKPPWEEYTGHRKDLCRSDARAAVSTYLTALLGDIPEEALEAALRENAMVWAATSCSGCGELNCDDEGREVEVVELQEVVRIFAALSGPLPADAQPSSTPRSVTEKPAGEASDGG